MCGFGHILRGSIRLDCPSGQRDLTNALHFFPLLTLPTLLHPYQNLKSKESLAKSIHQSCGVFLPRTTGIWCVLVAISEVPTNSSCGLRSRVQVFIVVLPTVICLFSHTISPVCHKVLSTPGLVGTRNERCPLISGGSDFTLAPRSPISPSMASSSGPAPAKRCQLSTEASSARPEFIRTKIRHNPSVSDFLWECVVCQRRGIKSPTLLSFADTAGSL